MGAETNHKHTDSMTKKTAPCSPRFCGGLTWRQILHCLDESTLDCPAEVSCEPSDREPEDGVRYFGTICDMEGGVASYVGEPNIKRDVVATYAGTAPYGIKLRQEIWLYPNQRLVIEEAEAKV